MESHDPLQKNRPSPSRGPDLEASPDHSVVKFAPEPRVTLIESSWENSNNRRRTKMNKLVTYETFAHDEVTDPMIHDAANLFNENYGTWGPSSKKAGQPVKLSVERLRKQYLPDPSSSYTRVIADGTLAGNVFACRWDYQGNSVCWVTQLVVHKDHRGQGLAAGLLRKLRDPTDDIYGLMSSHPYACMAAAKSFGTTIEKIPLDFISANAGAILGASPVPYIKDAKLWGSIFGPDDTSGLISGVDTSFFVDHEEPLEALALVQQDWTWPFGRLPEGKEFLLLLRTRQSRSRSSSAGARDSAKPSR